MMAPLKSYAELLRLLPKLAPPPGKALVFRGQIQRSQSVLATGLRTGRPYDAPWIWFAYSILVARRFKLIEGLRAEFAGTGPRASDAIANEELFFMFAVGMDAFAQHYGPGSRFLDVTRSLDTALWFALNRSEASDLVAVPQNPAELFSNLDTMSIHKRLSYSPAAEGWLYAFHVPEFDRQHGLAQGVLVDLMAQGVPRFFQTSTRLQAQRACLVFGGEGDLSPFLACDPIPVARPLAGAPQLDASLDTLFPGPDNDPWYSIMLAIPPSPIYEPETRSLQFRQPTQVEIYAGEGGQEAAPFVRRMRKLQPMALDDRLHFAGSAMPLEWPHEIRTFFAAQRPDHAPVLLLDAPVMRFHSPLEQWRAELLFTGLAEQATVHDPADGQPIGTIPLTNVMIEVSPLEFTFWDAASFAPNEEPMRAIWIARIDDCYAMCSIHEPGADLQPIVKQPAFARFNRMLNRLEHYAGGSWTGMSSEDAMAAALVASADLLRNLAPGSKPNARPNALGIGNAQSPSGLSDEAYPLRLDAYRTPGSSEARFLVRNMHTNGPYIPLNIIFERTG